VSRSATYLGDGLAYPFRVSSPPSVSGSSGQGESAWRGHRRGSREHRLILLALFFAGVSTFAQLYSPQALLPSISTTLDVAPSTAALVLSASTIGIAVGVIPWSVVADRLGRVRAMTIALSGAAIVGLLVPFAPGIPLLLTGRLLEGLLVAGVPAVAIAYLTDEIHAADALRAAGIYVAGTTVGGLAGRLVAGPVGEWLGWRAGIVSVALLSAVSAVCFVLLVPPARGFTHHGWSRPAPGSFARVARGLVRHLRNPRLLALYTQAFLLMGAFVALYNYLGFHLGDPPFLLSEASISLFFLAYLAGTASSALIGGPVQVFGRRRALVASSALMVLGVVLTLAPSLPVVVLGLVLATGGFFAAHAIASAWVGGEVAEGRAQAASLYNLFYYAGSSLFGWLGGLFIVVWGWPGVVAMVGGMVTLAVVVALSVLRDRTTSTS
jgi:YNFM family putative membrane transporter